MSTTIERAKVEVGADTTGLATGLAQARRMVGRFAGQTARRISNLLGNVGGGLTAITGLGAVGGLALAANDSLAFEDGLTRIAIQANATAAETDVLRQSMSRTATEFGLSRRMVLGGVDALVNLQGASAATPENIELIGKAMAATGADARDLAGTMFSLQDTFDLDASELEATLSGITAQGKAASIPLAELATTLQQQASNLVDLTGQGTEGAAKTVAVLQVLRKGFGSATEAGTGAKAIGNAFKGNAAKLRKFGVEVYRMEGGKKVFRDIRDIITDIGESKLAKNPTLLAKTLGSSEAETAVRVLSRNLDVYDDLVEAGRQHDTIQRDANKYMSSAVGRQKAAIAKLKETIEGVFTPETIEGFAIALEAAVKWAGQLLDTFLEVAEAIGPLRDA
ncbi:MAG: phage tail tape measure protein, partial [Myxococcota bacterium]